MVVDSAYDDHFDAYYSKPASIDAAPVSHTDSVLNSYFDGSASWFTKVATHPVRTS